MGKLLMLNSSYGQMEDIMEELLSMIYNGLQLIGTLMVVIFGSKFNPITSSGTEWLLFILWDLLRSLLQEWEIQPLQANILQPELQLKPLLMDIILVHSLLNLLIDKEMEQLFMHLIVSLLNMDILILELPQQLKH